MNNISFSFCFLLALAFIQIKAQSLNNIESVEYDPINDQFLISNGNSIVAQNYNSGELSFFGTAKATHGMEVIGENIFVIDGTTVRGYSLLDASEVMSISITGAQFLNGLTSDKIGMLYATDFSRKQILAIDVSDLSSPSFDIIVLNTQLTPNGIHYDQSDERLIFVTWGSNASVRAIDLNDLSISILASTSYGNMDGVVQDKDGNFLISTWSPARIIKFDSNFTTPAEEITLPTSLINPADIGIAVEKDILGIPHYPVSGDEVVFVDLNPKVGVSDNDLGKLEIQEVDISPNPSSSSANLQFNLSKPKHLAIVLLNTSGQIIETLAKQEFAAGKQKVFLNFSDISKGPYFIQIKSSEAMATYPIIHQ